MPFVKGVLARRPDDFEAAAELLLEFGFDPVELTTPKLSYEPRWSCQCATCAAMWVASKSGDVMRIDLATDDPRRPPRQTWFPGNQEARTIFHQHDGAALRAGPEATGSNSVLLIGRDDGYLDVVPDDHSDWSIEQPHQPRRADGFGSFHLDSWWWEIEHAPPGDKRDDLAIDDRLELAHHDSASYAMGVTAITVLQRPDESNKLDIIVATRHPSLYVLEATAGTDDGARAAGRLRLRRRIPMPGWIEWIIDPAPGDDHVTCISRGGDIVRFSPSELRDEPPRHGPGKRDRAPTWVSRLPTAALRFRSGILLGTTTGLFLVCEKHPAGIAVPVTRSPVLCLDSVKLGRQSQPASEYIVMGLDDGRLRVIDAGLLADLASGCRDPSEVVDEDPAAAGGSDETDAEPRPNFAIQMNDGVLAVETLQADDDSHEAYVLAVLRDHSIRLYHTTSPRGQRPRIRDLWIKHVASLELPAGDSGAVLDRYDRELIAAGGTLAPAWSDAGRSTAWRHMLVEVVLPRLLAIAPNDRDAQREVVALACTLADAADRRVLQRLTAAMARLTRGVVAPVERILVLSRHILRAVPHRDEPRWWAFIEHHLRDLHDLTRRFRNFQAGDRERLVAWTRFVRKYVLLGTTFGKKLELLDLVETCYQTEKYLDALIYQARLSQRCYDMRWDIAIGSDVDGLYVVPCGEGHTLVVVVTTEGKLAIHDGATGSPLTVEHRDRPVVMMPFGKDRAITACAVVGIGDRFWIAASCTHADVASPGVHILALAWSAERPHVVQLVEDCREVVCTYPGTRVCALQLLPDRVDLSEPRPPSFVAGLENPATPVGLLYRTDGTWTLELAQDERSDAPSGDGRAGASDKMATRALAVAAFDDHATHFLLVAGSDDGLIRAARFTAGRAVRDWEVRRWDRLSDAITGIVLGRHRTGLVPDADESLFSCYLTTRGGDVVALAVVEGGARTGEPTATHFACYDAQPLWRETHDGPILDVRLWRTPLYQADEVLVVVTEKGRLCLYNHSLSTGKERVSATSNYYFRGMRFDRVTLPDRTRALTMIENGDRFIAAGRGKRLYMAQLVYLRDSVERRDREAEPPPLAAPSDAPRGGANGSGHGLPDEMWERMNHLFAQINQAEVFHIDSAKHSEIEQTKLDLLDLVRLGGNELQRYGLQRRLKFLEHWDENKEADLRRQALERLEPLDPEVLEDAEKIKVILKSLCFARLYRNPRELRRELVDRPSATPIRREETAMTCEVVASYVARKLDYPSGAAARLRIAAIKELLRVPMLRYLAHDVPDDAGHPRILRAVTSMLTSCLNDEEHMVRNEALRALSIMLSNVVVMADAVADEHAQRGADRDPAGRNARSEFLATLFPRSLGSLEWILELLIEGLRRMPSFTRRTALASASWYHIAALVPLFRLFPERTLALCDYLMCAGLSIEVLALCHQALRRPGPTRIRSRIRHLYLIPALDSADAQREFVAAYDETSKQHAALQRDIALMRDEPAPQTEDGKLAWWQIDDATMADRLCMLHRRLARMWNVQRHQHIDDEMADVPRATMRSDDTLHALELVVAELAAIARALRDPRVLKSRALDRLDDVVRGFVAPADGKGTLTAQQRAIVQGIVVAWRTAYAPRKGTMLADEFKLGDLVTDDGLGMMFGLDQPGVWRGRYLVKLLQRSNATDAVGRFIAGAEFQQQLSKMQPRHIVPITRILAEPRYQPYVGYTIETPRSSSLEERLCNGLHHAKDAVAWAEQAAREIGWALHAAHHAGGWHGYLRPSSIFVTDADDDRMFRLGDFDLAFCHDDASDAPIGVVPACLSERCRDASPLVQRQWDDIAALSLVLHRILTGTTIDPGVTDMGDHVKELWALAPDNEAAGKSRVVELLGQIFEEDLVLTIDQFLARLDALMAAEQPAPPAAPPVEKLLPSTPVVIAMPAVPDVRRRRNPTRDIRADAAVLITSDHEFEQFAEVVELARPIRDKQGGHYFPFEAPGDERPYRGVAQLIGEASTLAAHGPATRMLERWQPRVAVMIGVAASLDDRIKLGDVVVATQIDAYDAIWQIQVGPGGMTVRHQGTVFQADWQLLAAVTPAPFLDRKEFEEFARACSNDCDAVLMPGTRNRLQKSKLLSLPPTIHRGHVASGNVVTEAAEFAQSLRTRDAGLLALDTGSAALAAVAHGHQPPVPVLVLRGISDVPGRDVNSVVRRYAMRNAVRYLLLLARLGVLPRHPASPGR